MNRCFFIFSLFYFSQFKTAAVEQNLCWLALTVSLTDLKITWKESPNEEFCRSGHAGMSMVECLGCQLI